MVTDFTFFENVDRFFPSAFAGESFKLGSLLRFLFVQSGIDANMQGNFYRKYLHGFTKGWSFEYGHSVNLDAIPLPVLIRTLDGKPDNENRTENLEGIKFSRVLSSVYVQSRHPPHIFDFFKGDRVHLVSGGMIPFCWYGNENIKSSGIKLGPYGNRYCHTFQETFNENGLCYTYNARYLNTNGIGLPDWRTKYFEAKKVAGIGPDKGLRLIIDSSKIAHKAKSSQHLSGGFDVFIGDPGSVTQYARYRIYPDSNGEYSFRMQSSSIEASNEDIDSLSKQDKLCSSRNAQNLKYVRGYYSRSSCLMECIIARVSEECGCAPWFVNQTKYPICNSKGNQCYHDKRGEFHEGEQCHCRPDCVRHNFFVTMSFVERKFSESKGYYYNPQDSSGILADYLLDPQHFFQDEIVHNLTKLLYNYSNEELAEKRFEEDISILNFYFDTIYTTKITKTLRWTIWDKIATLGGSLCFFIGLSILSAAELVYWFLSFVMAVLKKWFQNSMNLVLDMGTKNVEATVPVRRERMVFVNNVQIHPRTPLPQMTDVS